MEGKVERLSARRDEETGGHARDNSRGYHKPRELIAMRIDCAVRA